MTLTAPVTMPAMVTHNAIPFPPPIFSHLPLMNMSVNPSAALFCVVLNRLKRLSSHPLLPHPPHTQLDTTAPKEMTKRLSSHPQSSGKPAQVKVNLGLLKSYEHMGVVQVECVSGCSCKATKFNTDDPKDHSSQTTFYPLSVSQSPQCVLALTCLEESTSIGKEHKIILRAISVSAHQTLGVH